MSDGFEAGRVSAARLLTSHVRNVTIAAESLVGFAFEPGAAVAIRLPRGDGGADERHYSVWKSTVEGRVDLCVTLHGLGPGSRWACFEVASMDHRWPEPEVARPEEVRWVDRAGRPGTALVSWLARQTLPSTKNTTAYVTGEAWLCATVHAHLVRDRGFPVRAVRAMPYWKTKSRSP